MIPSQGEATGFRERIGTTILAGWKHARTESLRESESERREELEMSEVRRMCLRNLGIKTDEQVAVRHADASGGYIIEEQHEKRNERETSKSTKEPEATNEDQTDEWRKTMRFEREAPNTSAFSDPHVALEHLVRDETPSRPGSVLVQKSGHVGDDVHTSALDAFYEKDGRRSRYIGEVLERYRGEDAGDLKRSALDELVENWTSLNVLEKEILKK